MNLMKLLAVSASALFGLSTATGVHADEADARGAPNQSNNDFVAWIGMAAEPATHTARYRGTNDLAGGYSCHNIAAGGNRLIRYPFTLPNLRDFDFVRIWGNKAADTANPTMRLKRSCMLTSQTDPDVTTLGTTSVTGAPGDFSTLINIPGEEIPNNSSCRYWLEVEFGSTGEACASTFDRLVIRNIRLQSRLTDRIFRSAFRAAP